MVIEVQDPQALRAHSEDRARGRVKASPLARRRARAAGITLDDLQGSGPGGRVIARDVAAHAAIGGPDRGAIGQSSAAGHSHDTTAVAMRRTDSADATRGQLAYIETALPLACDDAALARESYAPGSYVARSHDPRRRMFVDRLVMAHTHVPQLTLHADVFLDEMERALKRMNHGHITLGPRALSLNICDVLVKAMGLALRQVPEANVSYTQAAILQHGAADVAVAMLPDTASEMEEIHKGRDFSMVAPVIAHADLKSLSEISDEVEALRTMVRSGNLEPAAIRGGVTTVFDLSGSAVSGCETLVIPPQSSVLVMGAADAKAVVVDGSVVVRACARMSLSVDQRAIDARAAVRLLSAVKAYAEDPMRMLV